MKVLKEIYDYRQMIFSLVHKDLRGRYKASVLGFLWTFINPLLQLGVYTLVFSVILPSTIDKFYLYLFVALIPWIFFSSCITAGATSIVNSKDMVQKIYFPREVMPISYVTSAFINMLFGFIVIFAVVLFSGIGVNFVALLYLPLIMGAEYVLALGAALLVSSLTVYFRDLEYILSILTMTLMYMTPIMYPISMIPEELLPIFSMNPMTPIITAYRDVLYYKQIPQMETLLHGFILGIIVLIIGEVLFRKLQRGFAEEL